MRTGKNGFTLMEMVITLTMLAILAAIAGPYLANGVRAYNDSSSSVHTLSNLRSASERLVREIREIRRDGSTGNYDITSPVQNPSSTLRFFKTDAERVTFTDAAPLLMMSYLSVSGETPYTLSDELSSITFRYWQSDGITPANLSTVAIIEFELVLTHAGNNYPQRSRVALRNQP